MMRAIFILGNVLGTIAFLRRDLLPGILWSATVRPSPNTGLHAG
jgi:hypothetical protein